MKHPVLFVLWLATACGPKPSATSAGGATAELPDVPFDQLDHEQRIQFMKEKTVPTMTPIFQGHDAMKYQGFGCKTCHGEGADKGEFYMPNEQLPKLNFADMSKFKKADVDWMKTEVLPTMANLLKQELHTQENPQGFGCVNCHTLEVR